MRLISSHRGEWKKIKHGLTNYSEIYAVRILVFLWFKLTDVFSLRFHPGHRHLNCEVGERLWLWDVITAKRFAIKKYVQSLGCHFRVNLAFLLGAPDLTLAQKTPAQVDVLSQDCCDVVSDLKDPLSTRPRDTKQQDAREQRKVISSPERVWGQMWMFLTDSR